jgi:type III pantothenate kinase
MSPEVVVDIGNTRIKWGRCSPAAILDTAALPPEDGEAWQKQAELWQLPRPARWVLAGVHPTRCEHFADWLHRRGDEGLLVSRAEQLPLRVLVDKPDHVGIDRLFDAVAANSRRRPDSPAMVIDAGTAITVNCLDAAGAFVGGAILPGMRLMARALHDHTALLPLVDPPSAAPSPLGVSTLPSIQAGTFYAAVGAIEQFTRWYGEAARTPLQVFLTGGDAALLHPRVAGTDLWTGMTLEGMRLTAEALP